jgi:hypothetical protein
MPPLSTFQLSRFWVLGHAIENNLENKTTKHHAKPASKTQEKAFRINTATHLEKSAGWSFESPVIHFGFFARGLGKKDSVPAGVCALGARRTARKSVEKHSLSWCYSGATRVIFSHRLTLLSAIGRFAKPFCFCSFAIRDRWTPARAGTEKGFEGREGHRTPFASAGILQGGYTKHRETRKSAPVRCRCYPLSGKQPREGLRWTAARTGWARRSATERVEPFKLLVCARAKKKR